MITIEAWWSPVAQAYRVEDGEMFTYYELDQVIGHFVNRDRPATAQLVAPPHGEQTAALDRALRRAGVQIEYSEVSA